MDFGARRLLVLTASVMLIGCSMTVPAEKVYGTYVVSYPFGTETITLNRDGTFSQHVATSEQILLIEVG
jgi:hypothetical protein